jgi:hypothetical protein
MEVGLSSVGSFTTSFKRTYQLTPTEYRAAYPAAALRARIPTCFAMAAARPAGSPRRVPAPLPLPADEGVTAISWASATPSDSSFGEDAESAAP